MKRYTVAMKKRPNGVVDSWLEADEAGDVVRAEDAEQENRRLREALRELLHKVLQHEQYSCWLPSMQAAIQMAEQALRGGEE